jgi:ATP-dependent Clp protease protease subunit
MTEKTKLSEIWVNDFDQTAVNSFRSLLIEHHEETPPEAPLVIYINSFGGSAAGLSAMIDTIDALDRNIITACMGVAMSAGAILLSHGDMRFCAKNSKIMIHELQSAAFGSMTDMENDIEFSKEINTSILKLLAKNCSKSVKEVMESIKYKGRAEKYMSAAQALSFGIIDKIGVPVVVPKTQYFVDVR